MTIDSAYFKETRQPKPNDDLVYYYEFEAATDSVVEVYLNDPVSGKRIRLERTEAQS